MVIKLSTLIRVWITMLDRVLLESIMKEEIGVEYLSMKKTNVVNFLMVISFLITVAILVVILEKVLFGN